MPKFAEFRMGDLFDIHPTKSYGLTNAKLFKTKGKTPVIVNSSRDNGVGGFVGLKPTEKGSIITFSDTTTADSIFYQPNDFIGYSHVQGVYPKEPEKWTKEALLFVVANFRKVTAGRFDYATKFSRAIAIELKISIPVTEDGEIDFEYMQRYICGLEDTCICEFKTYLKAAGLTDYGLTVEEEQFMEKYYNSEVKWNKFKLGDLFNWQPQREIRPLDIDKYKVKDGKAYPFYGQATINNGIISYLSLSDDVLNNQQGKPTILIHSNNQNIVYLETPFYLKDGHGATSVLQSDFLSRETALFLIACIKKVIVNIFSYNEKATKIALKNTEIQLPIVDNSGLPDYDYMTRFIRIQQKLAIKNIAEQKGKELEAYRVVTAI